MLSATNEELLYLADQQAYARSRYHEDDADLIRESLVIEQALRLSAQQREPVVRVKELKWADADEGMCTKWRACALGGHYELVALDGDGGGLAVNFYWGRPLSFWFIQGEPDEWGPTGPKMFPTLDAAKSAAQADYEQRIMSAIEIQSSDVEACRDYSEASRRDNSEPEPSMSEASTGGCCSSISPCQHQRNNPTTICDACKAAHEASGRSQPSPDVSVDELADWLLNNFSLNADHKADARALLARYKIERLDRLESGRRG